MQPQLTAVGPAGPELTAAFEAYSARRAYAYAAGEAKARKREISADAYLFLYKELVGLAGDRTYCWPGLEFLVALLDTSSGTVKRWMKELEHAGLIRRKPRPGGQTSLTYITAYLQLDHESPSEPAPHNERDGDGDLGEAESELVARTSAADAPVDEAEPSCASPAHDMQPPQPPVFFGLPKEIVSDRSTGSALIPRTFKTQELKNPGGCGGGTQSELARAVLAAETEITALLAAEEIIDPVAVNELRSKPLDELQAISRYLDTQTNIRSRPALFVWLARHGFGAALLQERKRPEARRYRARQAPKVHASGGYCPPEPPHEPTDHVLAGVWQRVQAHVAAELSKDEYDTWIEPLTLVALEDDLAVVGTPNIFVRCEVERAYKAHLEAALARACGRPVVLQAVIG